MPIKPITEFIRYLNNVEKSPFTVGSYAYHLKLFWEFLDVKQLDWTKINLSSLSDSAPHINRALNKLARENNFVNGNGIIYKFSSHQFRHAVGTQMINSGVPQVMVQHYLGHESPEMTARYAHIHNEALEIRRKDDIPINVESVSKFTNASRRWIYNNNENALSPRSKFFTER